ncbi:heterogeneous nuclear ribonucleoprotein A0 [Trifolium repens]|nr:heterogeneous nuclear ribonucleoprotein A0 [Trifolium repens]
MGWDGGEWTEVRRRRRKEYRQVNTSIDNMRQGKRYRREVTPISNWFASSDRRTRSNPFHRDRLPFGQVQPRYSDADTCYQYYRDHDYSRSAYSRSRDSRRQFLGVRRQQDKVMLQQRRAVEDDHLIPRYGDGKKGQNLVGVEGESSGLKWYVSFYFTNFPVQLSLFYLRKGFEVCGILEDVYVARKRNKHGQPYGFVRFSNVRDISKLNKALNVVSFGDFRVRARVARFDRNIVPFVEPPKAGVVKGVVGLGKAVDKPKEKNVSEKVETPRMAAKPRTDALASTANEGFESQEGVRVGEVLVRLGEQRGKVDEPGTQKQGEVLKVDSVNVAGQDSRTYVRSYRSVSDDVD